MNCPECGTHKVTNTGMEEQNDGQGYWERYTYFWICEECHCNWEQIKTIETEINIIE